MVAWLCVALLPVSGPPVFLLPLTSNFLRGHKTYMASTRVRLLQIWTLTLLTST